MTDWGPPPPIPSFDPNLEAPPIPSFTGTAPGPPPIPSWDGGAAPLSPGGNEPELPPAPDGLPPPPESNTTVSKQTAPDPLANPFGFAPPAPKPTGGFQQPSLFKLPMAGFGSGSLFKPPVFGSASSPTHAASQAPPPPLVPTNGHAPSSPLVTGMTAPAIPSWTVPSVPSVPIPTSVNTAPSMPQSDDDPPPPPPDDDEPPGPLPTFQAKPQVVVSPAPTPVTKSTSEMTASEVRARLAERRSVDVPQLAPKVPEPVQVPVQKEKESPSPLQLKPALGRPSSASTSTTLSPQVTSSPPPSGATLSSPPTVNRTSSIPPPPQQERPRGGSTWFGGKKEVKKEETSAEQEAVPITNPLFVDVSKGQSKPQAKAGAQARLQDLFERARPASPHRKSQPEIKVEVKTPAPSSPTHHGSLSALAQQNGTASPTQTTTTTTQSQSQTSSPPASTTGPAYITKEGNQWWQTPFVCVGKYAVGARLLCYLFQKAQAFPDLFTSQPLQLQVDNIEKFMASHPKDKLAALLTNKVLDEYHITSVAHALRNWLRKNEVFPASYYEWSMKAFNDQSKQMAASSFKMGIERLPVETQVFLTQMLGFLSVQCNNGKLTGMDSQKLASHFGVLIIKPTDDKATPGDLQIKYYKTCASVCQLWIDEFATIFAVASKYQLKDPNKVELPAGPEFLSTRNRGLSGFTQGTMTSRVAAASHLNI